MDIIPLYELRNRLRASMIAGTNLIDEDFRLKRAVEDVKPLEKASPVFAKIVKSCEILTTDKNADSEYLLLDTITLLDAVICTQGAVEVNHKENMREIEASGSGLMLKNVPYSTLKPVIEALTTSGNGHLTYLQEVYGRNPEIFKDYRVLEGLVTALGAGYTELADSAEGWLKENGSEILPLLMNGFNPKGKKEMLRRLSVIEYIAGGKANDFYLANLDESEKDIRQALIYALRHHQQNTELLIELAKNEKGNGKKMAYAALAYMESDEAAEFFENLYKKKPENVMEAIFLSNTQWSSKMAARCFKSQLDKWQESFEKGETIVLDKKAENLLNHTLYALAGKNGEEVCEVLKQAATLDEQCRILSEQNNSEYAGYIYTDFRTVGYRSYGALFQLENVPRVQNKEDLLTLKDLIAHLSGLNLIIHPDEGLKKLVFDLQDNSTFFGAAINAHLLYDAHFCDWIKGKLEDDKFVKSLSNKTGKHILGKLMNSLGNKTKRQILENIAYKMMYLTYDKKTKQYVLTASLVNANKEWNVYSQPVTADVKGELTEFMIRQSMVFDHVLEQCIDEEDVDYKKRLEEYFYQCALASAWSDCLNYWQALIKCGCERCEGLFVNAVSKTYSISGEIYGNSLYSMLYWLPGTREAKVAEATKVLEYIRSNKVKVKYFDEEVFEKEIYNID